MSWRGANDNLGDIIMKKIFVTAAFAILIASPALAATQGQNRNAARAEASYASAVPYSGIVVVDGKVVGQDPDAFIRSQLLRAGDPAEQNGGN
jgi:hypothetical protein